MACSSWSLRKKGKKELNPNVFEKKGDLEKERVDQSNQPLRLTPVVNMTGNQINKKLWKNRVK